MTHQEQAAYDASMRAAAEMNAAAEALEQRAKTLREESARLWSAASQYQGPDLEDVQQRSCKSKARYKTAQGAGEAARVFTARRGDKLRVYPCQFCQGFHLTKETLEQFARVDE